MSSSKLFTDENLSLLLDKLDYAFQPIVNTYNGKTFAVEALIRGYQNLGFQSIPDLFDNFFEKKILYKVDLLLRRKAIEKFKYIKIENIKLFYNLDNRLLFMPDFEKGNTTKILQELNLKQDSICFEITENGTMQNKIMVNKILNNYKSEGYNIAIDDFGTGISGLELLYLSEAHYIKLDRFFIRNINKDSRKKLFCSSIVDMAHIMGIKVIAEGIEEIAEYYTCKDINIDYIQGFLISKPTINIEHIKSSYDNIPNLFENDRRNKSNNLIDKDYIEYIEPLNINSSLHDLFLYFKEYPNNNFVPIINEYKTLIGVIHEVDIKKISYSQYGLALAQNVSFKSKLSSYLKQTLSIEISWGIDKTLEMFNLKGNQSKGIFVTKNGKYAGFINVNNLLSLSYKRNLEIAQNQNPLTKLPGNNQINNFLNESFKNEQITHIVYFDFNDFKPFNDYYGFRQGDRAILIFSELLQKHLEKDTFIAHIGGDDFFIGFKNKEFEFVYKLIAQIQEAFKNNVSSLYNEKELQNGYILTKDRFGVQRKFSLLSVSSAIIEISNKSKQENFDKIIGKIKKDSKEIPVPMGSCILM
ncbi:GGDEF domain-containing protein [Malaciobacter mytili]|uniref:GGDEF domain-containing protein n=1 Tax=Malaciobacter mytili LMG 24559 TaxID=1032238 RepID=A0AAX2AHM1_9BACT|nr:bifunctional diguanylate cyclase/phosphodiesterase [Malaciobacter mytili]AXH13818.1 diguanylate cyclase/phosphodiesterase [Malaciobacter mytili LMG 24559]RXI41404.1 GGDEF domain-containing protein [Malaciobacter mytili]RXK15528.1 GGDEF domain-containing protein [Malaciobacter mytili LMG 24559]